MPVGKSNRIVVDLGLEKKRKLYARLARDGKTMGYWFQDQVDRYLEGLDFLRCPFYSTKMIELRPKIEAADS